MSTDTPEPFLTLAGDGEANLRVRASRFMAIAFPVADEEEARRRLLDRSGAYHDASHHCAAWRLRDGTWRALDAGEPGGSAGQPILTAIDAVPLLDTAVIVTRYFGGTKLGVGGLIRAYGDAAAAALAAAPKRRGIPAARVRIQYPYAMTSVVMRVVERFATQAVEHDFAAGGTAAILRFTVPAGDLAALDTLLVEASAGDLALTIDGHTVIFEPTSG